MSLIFVLCVILSYIVGVLIGRKTNVTSPEVLDKMSGLQVYCSVVGLFGAGMVTLIIVAAIFQGCGVHR